MQPPLSEIKIRDLVLHRLVLDLPETDKTEVLRRLCQAMVGDPRVLDGTGLFQAMLQREQLASTGIGLGLAIPHVRLPQVTDFILAIGRSRAGIDFESQDLQPVHLLFMLAAPPHQMRPFIHLLARITEVLKCDKVRQALLDAPTTEDFAEICQRYEW